MKKTADLLEMLKAPKTREAFGRLASRHMTPERMAGLSIMAVNKTPDLLKCNPISVLGAFMTAAALGLEPNTPRGLAYLIPFKRRAPELDNRGQQIKDSRGQVIWADVWDCNFIIGYKGFVELAYRSDRIVRVTAHAVRQNDLFEYQDGSSQFLNYSKRLVDRGPLVGAFSYARMVNPRGTEAEDFTVLGLDHIEKVRDRSETYRALKAKLSSGDKRAAEKYEATPWVAWEDDMAAKTALRNHAKWLPLGEAGAAAVEIDERAESGQVDWSQMADPDAAREVAAGGNAPMRDEPAMEPEETEPAALTAPEPPMEPIGEPERVPRASSRGKRQDVPDFGD